MNKEIDKYIDKQKSPQKEICQKLRMLIHKILPKASEEMRWGVPVFANGKFYIAGMRNDVNIGFAVTGLSAKEKNFFKGSGKIMRHLKIAKIEDIDEQLLAKLLRMVDKKIKCTQC